MNGKLVQFKKSSGASNGNSYVNNIKTNCSGACRKDNGDAS